MAKLDLSWVSLNKVKSKSPSSLASSVNNSTLPHSHSLDTAQPKVVKLNRRSLGLNINETVKCVEKKHCPESTEDTQVTVGMSFLRLVDLF